MWPKRWVHMGHTEAKCGDAALVVYCSVMDHCNPVAYSLAHSSLGQGSGHHMTGFSAKDLPPGQATLSSGGQCPLPSLWHDSGLCGCRTEVSISLLALLPEASLLPCHMFPSIFKASHGEFPFHQTPFMLQISLPEQSPVSFEDWPS